MRAKVCLLIAAIALVLLSACTSTDSESSYVEDSSEIVTESSEASSEAVETSIFVEEVSDEEPTSYAEASEEDESVEVTYSTLDSSGVPALSKKGQTLKSFVVEGWSLLDSVELDYNSDGQTDYIGVLNYDDQTEEAYPRILFAVYGDNGKFTLDFQNTTLVSTADEGGPYGDPYEPLEATKDKFTVSAYGGSAWRWSNSETFRWINGVWYLVQSEYMSFYSAEVVSAQSDNYETGIGIRQVNDDSFGGIELIDSNKFALEYQVRLDPMPTLEEVGQSNLRFDGIDIKSISIADGLSISKADIPLQSGYNKLEDLSFPIQLSYADSSYLLFVIQYRFLAVYDRNTKDFRVIAEAGETYFSNERVYKGRVYWGINTDDALQVFSSKLDGSDIKTLFEQEIIESDREGYKPYHVFFEIGGDEIVFKATQDLRVEYYRKKLNSDSLESIGVIQQIGDE